MQEVNITKAKMQNWVSLLLLCFSLGFSFKASASECPLQVAAHEIASLVIRSRDLDHKLLDPLEQILTKQPQVIPSLLSLLGDTYLEAEPQSSVIRILEVLRDISLIENRELNVFLTQNFWRITRDIAHHKVYGYEITDKLMRSLGQSRLNLSMGSALQAISVLKFEFLLGAGRAGWALTLLERVPRQNRKLSLAEVESIWKGCRAVPKQLTPSDGPAVLLNIGWRDTQGVRGLRAYLDQALSASNTAAIAQGQTLKVLPEEILRINQTLAAVKESIRRTHRPKLEGVNPEINPKEFESFPDNIDVENASERLAHIQYILSYLFKVNTSEPPFAHIAHEDAGAAAQRQANKDEAKRHIYEIEVILNAIEPSFAP